MAASSVKLRLYNTFSRSLKSVEISGKTIGTNAGGYSTTTGQSLPDYGTFYICGPTVYSDSHVGHALTYIRADLFRRFMKSIFNVKLITVMNITDIDDKILDKTRKEYAIDCSDYIQPSSHPFNKVSEKYYKSFIDDLKSIRVLPADLHIKVSKHMPLISAFIAKLESTGHAYISSNGDVNFNVSSIKNYVGRVDVRLSENDPLDWSKNDQRDFALWKAAKPGEPVWIHESGGPKRVKIPGRPGWHVQCSAISSALFGNKLDFHFGGKDLIFPHHYNEEACCCAFHGLDTSQSLHVWANVWLHSGHLIIRAAKMSKSLGNVVSIKSFISRSSVNALRLLCVHNHYRSDLEFDEDLIDRLKVLDHKLSAFSTFLRQELRNNNEALYKMDLVDKSVKGKEEANSTNDSLEHIILKTHEDILEGICNDFHLDKGLESIINLSKEIYSRDVRKLRPRDLVASWSLLKDWCDSCGLDYISMGNSSLSSNDESLLNILTDFRQKVRSLTLGELKERQRLAHTSSRDDSLQKLLKECDNVRAQLDEFGFVSRDSKS